MTRQRVLNDMIDPSDRQELIDSSEPADAIEPTERTEPTEPIERIEPFDAIDRTEFSDHNDHRDVSDALRTKPILGAGLIGRVRRSQVSRTVRAHEIVREASLCCEWRSARRLRRRSKHQPPSRDYLSAVMPAPAGSSR
jgi:hypothetical protein